MSKNLVFLMFDRQPGKFTVSLEQPADVQLQLDSGTYTAYGKTFPIGHCCSLLYDPHLKAGQRSIGTIGVFNHEDTQHLTSMVNTIAELSRSPVDDHR